jgi:hypothetical protein
LKPRVLFLVPADYDELRRKGTDRMIQERDEDGFFERVITIHPLARQARTVDLNPIHRIHEFALGRALGSQPSGIRARLSAPFRLAAVFRAVVRIARDERIDLVRATDPYLMGLLAWRVSRALRVPFCVSLHADYTKRFALTPKRAGGAWLRRAARFLPSFVFPRAHMPIWCCPSGSTWLRRSSAPGADAARSASFPTASTSRRSPHHCRSTSVPSFEFLRPPPSSVLSADWQVTITRRTSRKSARRRLRAGR